jgi:hypothetical protein
VRPWSRTKVELDDQLRLLGFNIQHGAVVQEEEEEPAYHFTTYHYGASSSSYQTMVLLCHTTEALPHGRVGRVGIDLHLGQKPKLGGGGTPTIHSSTYYILSDLCISMFCLLYCSSSYFCFPKHKKTKNISVVSLYLVLWFSTFGLL